MIALADKTNVEAPSAEYPFGRIKDNTGANNGTPVNRTVYSDIHQFFEKLMSEANITPNGIPDNEYDGFQLFEALEKLVKPYDSYNAILSQAGTAAPSASVLGFNQIGSIVWSRVSMGVYNGTLVGAFPFATTFILVGSGLLGAHTIRAFRLSDDVIRVISQDAGSPADDILLTAIEIRVYKY